MDRSGGLHLSLKMLDRNSPDYFGYDTTVKLEVPSIRYFFLNKYALRVRTLIARCITEITNYLSAFSDMREVVELQASAVVSATKENVKKSEDKILLDISIRSPEIIIPASTRSPNHLAFKLGLTQLLFILICR